MLKSPLYWARPKYFYNKLTVSRRNQSEPQILSLKNFWILMAEFHLQSYPKLGTNFNHLAGTIVNEMRKGSILCTKGPIFSLNPTQPPFWFKIYVSFSYSGQYSTESIESFQTCATSYSCWQRATVLNKSEWKFSSNHAQFCSLHRWAISVLFLSHISLLSDNFIEIRLECRCLQKCFLIWNYYDGCWWAPLLVLTQSKETDFCSNLVLVTTKTRFWHNYS